MKLPLFSLCAALSLIACRTAPDDLREWRVSDHDHTTNPSSGQVEGKSEGQNPLASFGIEQVTLITWRQNCTRCHGSLGRGDGPQGALTHARNLTDLDWQASVDDAAIGLVIRQGKGLMPAFGTLPDSTIDQLVKLVRLFKKVNEGMAQNGHATRPAAASRPEKSGAHPPSPAPKPSR